MADFIPKAALDYIKNKNLKVGFSYKDVWNEEHAASFTVAKAMQIDVLSDFHEAVKQAVGNGQSFETFKKNIKPTLQQKGWWGRKEMTDPLTGHTVNAQLGSDRRLKTIYNVNMRSAYQKGQYDRTMASDLHPYLMYRIGPSIKHREEHAGWNGLILPKDDPFWDSHFPPNGWGCKCYTRAVSEAQKKKYENEGITVPPRADGTGGGKLKIKTQAPPDEIQYFLNDRKMTLEAVPKGIDPAFNWNQGKVSRENGAQEALEAAKRRYANVTKNIPTLADRQRTTELQQVSTPFFKNLKKESPEAFANMEIYSKGAGPEINNAIYNTDWENGTWAATIYSMDKTISKYPTLDAETWFFKGDNALYWKDWITGKSNAVKGFLGTSAVKGRAESYITENKKAIPFMVVIKAPKSTKGIYIGSNTAYNKRGPYKKNEYEYMFPRNTVFKVLEKGDSHIVLEAVIE